MFGQIGERNSAIVADFEEHEAARDHRNPTMTDIPPFRLGGEIDPNDWNFSRLGEAGPLPNPIGHTFPLLTHDVDQRWQLVGTSFYINDGGFFATARHVIEDVLKDGRQVSPSPGQDGWSLASQSERNCLRPQDRRSRGVFLVQEIACSTRTK
jgi:hypothetical protein